MTVLAPVNLHFEDSGHWYSLPEWAEYFISVGKHISATDTANGRSITAIVVPTRAYAAAFASLGIVIADAAERACPSAAAHFELMFDLPPGTPVIYWQKPDLSFKGILQAPAEDHGKLYLRVQVNSHDGGGLTHWINESRALQVQLAHHSGKLPKSQSGSVRLASGFVDALLGEGDRANLGFESKVVCAIVGRKGALEHEIRHTPLAVHANGDLHAQGMLQDILRVNRFIVGQQTHRSALIPVGSNSHPENVITCVEKAIVFDGAVGFLKWGNAWSGRHQVIILDRTEPYFDDAIAALNRQFMQNGADGEGTTPDFMAPPGGEILTFREPNK